MKTKSCALKYVVFSFHFPLYFVKIKTKIINKKKALNKDALFFFLIKFQVIKQALLFLFKFKLINAYSFISDLTIIENLFYKIIIVEDQVVVIKW